MSAKNPVVVVGTDLESGSIGMRSAAATWARAAGASVTLVHAVDDPRPTFPEPEAFAALRERSRDRRDADDRDRERRLEAEAKVFEGPGTPVRLHLAEGRPWQALLDLAIEQEALLVVVGGEERLSEEEEGAEWIDQVLGSTVDRVVRGTRCPVLVTPLGQNEKDGPSEGRWLAATDFSPASIAAMKNAAEWAERFGAQLTVAHVAEGEREESSSREEREAELGRFVAEHCPSADTLLIEGEEAATALCRAADEHGAALLTMGVQGQNADHLLLVGSTAERCLRRCRVPMLLVPGGAESPGRSEAGP